MNDVTLDELAVILKTDAGTLSRIEHRLRQPSESLQERIEQYFGRPIGTLLDATPDELFSTYSITPTEELELIQRHAEANELADLVT